MRSWGFQRGLPLKWSGPAMNAAQSAVAVETLEIAHEGWMALPLSMSLADAGKAFARVGQSVAKLF